MHNILQFSQEKQLNIIIPPTILSHNELSFNQKLILGLDYTLSLKLGFNSMTNKQVGELLCLHPNIVGYCRRHLVKNEFLRKDSRRYTITKKHIQFKVDDKRDVVLLCQIYNRGMTTGAKLLWGEYNSISKGHKEYFAKRLYTAKRLNASEESITNWTKMLFDNKLLQEYYHKMGYCKSQKIIITREFNS